MAQMPPSGYVVPVKRQPNIYTLLLIVAILALLATIVIVLNNLMSTGGYGMTFEQLFKKAEEFIPKG